MNNDQTRDDLIRAIYNNCTSNPARPEDVLKQIVYLIEKFSPELVPIFQGEAA